MILYDLFQEVRVINLARRPERWGRFMERLPKDWPFRKPIRDEAVDGEACPPPPDWNGGNGAWGCYRSHWRIGEDCLKRDVLSVLIMEDDAVMLDGFVEKATRFFEHLPDDWGLIYLGGQHLETTCGLPEKMDEFVYRPYNVNRCHAYGLRGRPMLETVCRHLRDYSAWKSRHHVDHRLGELHKSTRSGIYVPKEWLVAQSEGRSDICGKMLLERNFPGAEAICASNSLQQAGCEASG